MMKLINYDILQLLHYLKEKMSLLLHLFLVFMVLGNPEEYKEMVVSLRTGMEIERNQLLRKLSRYSI